MGPFVADWLWKLVLMSRDQWIREALKRAPKLTPADKAAIRAALPPVSAVK